MRGLLATRLGALRKAVAVLLLLGLAGGLGGCGSSWRHGMLIWRVSGSKAEATYDRDRLTIVISDSRPGRHTVWAIVRDAHGRIAWSGFASFHDGGKNGSAPQTLLTERPLRAGTYGYRFYDTEGINYRASGSDGPAWDCVASGRITVP